MDVATPGDADNNNENNNADKSNKSNKPKKPLKPNQQRSMLMVGQAGTHYAAMELLKAGVCTAEPAVDMGYDLITDAKGVLKRCQVKAMLDGTKDRQELHQIRFNMRRRKAKFSGQNVTENRDKQYTTDMIDVMICVSLKHSKIFIVPAHAIDFTKDWLYYRQIVQYESAWHVLHEPTKTAEARA